MPKFQGYVFVLWGDRFEEAIATIFITELRKAGLRVKVVGLSQRRTSGMYGLTLVPDLTLEEALPLAHQTICLVLPCQAPRVKRLENDPRLRDFFSQVQVNNTTFIAGQDTTNTGLISTLRENVVVYPNNGDLVAFARTVANQLR